MTPKRERDARKMVAAGPCMLSSMAKAASYLVAAVIGLSAPALAQAQGYASLDEKPYRSHYAHFETTIDGPIEKVWPHVLNIGSWMSDHKLMTLAGKPGQVGHFERVYPRHLGDDVPQPHYHLYGVAHIVPFKYIALEVFHEQGGSYGDDRPKMQFDNILLTDMGRTTKLTFLVIDVSRNKAAESAADVQGDKKVEEIIRKRLEHYFENLNRLVKNDK